MRPSQPSQPSGRRMAGGRPGVALLVLLSMGVVLAGCAGNAATPGLTALPSGPAASQPTPAGAATSPVDGLVVKLDSQGLTRVTGFELRTDDGRQLAFTMGTLENGVEFPPGHLAEHMATAQRIRVWFRDEGGQLVVYRIEDAS